jgi:hypothetical protein
MKKIVLFCAALLLVGCVSIPRPGVGSAPAASEPPYDAWAKVLQKFVDDQGRVDFAALAKDRADLDHFVDYVYDFGPNNAPQYFPTREHVLAYHINAYNALAMHKVLAAGIPASLDGFKKVSFFVLGKVRVGGEAISLYDYENKVIRPLGESRVHVALNCMSVSCPRLPQEPFLAQTLNAQLDREAQQFVAEARNVTVDKDKQVLHLSEIFKLYTKDFLAQAPSLAAWVNRFRTEKVPENFTTAYFPYDWHINKQP